MTWIILVWIVTAPHLGHVFGLLISSKVCQLSSHYSSSEKHSSTPGNTTLTLNSRVQEQPCRCLLWQNASSGQSTCLQKSAVFKAKSLVRGNYLLWEQQHCWEKMVSPLGTFCIPMTSPAFFLTCHWSQKSPEGYSFRVGGCTVLRGPCVNVYYTVTLLRLLLGHESLVNWRQGQ